MISGNTLISGVKVGPLGVKHGRLSTKWTKFLPEPVNWRELAKKPASCRCRTRARIASNRNGCFFDGVFGRLLSSIEKRLLPSVQVSRDSGGDFASS